MTVLLTPPAPDLRLLVSLATWTWADTRPDGHETAHILITRAPALTGSGTAETAEAGMRRLSASLGGLTGAREVVPELERCLQIVGDQVLLHVPGVSRRLRLSTRRPWTELVARNAEAVLLLGLDPLPQTADAARIDAYLDATLATDRLLFGRARTR
ncbi:MULTISPECIES: hypothetical protein [Streptomyces]|uniref:Uncharacterized protein n=1 Tax=Streptomyces zinciresistens K42 TaxID=700597 RepID=G2G3P3_9ACTN|nr:hypothetical protein [Streptomyces zinciresistens]EGX61789.1 hypothetical protein SZN_00470 [Streptomyces zinciresistens K42]